MGDCPRILVPEFFPEFGDCPRTFFRIRRLSPADPALKERPAILSEHWAFFRAYLKSPRVVASVVQSSAFVERRVVRAAGADAAKLLVELGPGTGDMTRALLAAMAPASRLVAIERTAEFLPHLGRLEDRRLEPVHGCASDIGAELRSRGLGAADAVVSGIPFAYLESSLAQDVVAAIRDNLAPGGRFVAYQITGTVADCMRPLMGEPRIEWEWRNVPPLRIFVWRKPSETADADLGTVPAAQHARAG